MLTVLRSVFGDRATPVWAPWLLMGAGVLYFVGYVDSSVHGAALGSPAILGAVMSSSTTDATCSLCATRLSAPPVPVRRLRAALSLLAHCALCRLGLGVQAGVVPSGSMAVKNSARFWRVLGESRE